MIQSNKIDKEVKTIGLVMEDSFTDFAKDIAHSVAHTIVHRKDLKLIVVAGRQDNCTDPNNKIHRYKQVFNSIYSINSTCKFDGLIFTFPNMMGVEEDLFGDVPKVYIAADKENEITVNYDNEMGVREALDYLVRIKGITKLCMLGGRDDNADAVKRKNVFFSYLKEAGLECSEDQYEPTDMSTDSHDAAAKLLARNPGVQAVFCANDPVAVGLYDVMFSKGLIPGKDVLVFGFDNGALAGYLVPSLASIGAAGITIGQRALELLLDMINGKEVHSEVIPTHLFGRDSLEYEPYKITTRDILKVDSSFIYSFFDDCFYRYKNEIVDPAAINLRRLFYEILSRMMLAIKNRYMDEGQYIQIKKLVDVFFENGAMKYTDANKYVSSITRLQNSMNETFRNVYSISYNNRLFLYMKDKAIQAQAFENAMNSQDQTAGRDRLTEFMINTVNFSNNSKDGIDDVIRNFEMIGFREAALYMFDKPVKYKGFDSIPHDIDLRCVLKEGSLYVIPENRRTCTVDEIFLRSELPNEDKGFMSFPLFYGDYLFGVLVCCVNKSVMTGGEYLSFLLGRTIYMNLMPPVIPE